ncbi:23S rRNA (adenine(2030)-N(6))-methyltransferase RlmJ [Amphritea balenae]|uniref:Ribosomal RNA large subunit methyltransferase J n=1 Tax=Amphritea balenae TaxID=452629 RepID=A0A3P1SWM7_9GAMM|nr:23S rRNA (adenine(2030)-N(6))-methyltransferase RlmJ [Amphritea balenae]RRD00523.1 23S rRNA (adenine(2030)-N(6))-methyltransferase RlmJ [Amphritea balenae]GGK70015.1 ribosomal RNA large subunit methyltransferase J [Amphritea balenae]
MLSYRHSYHAGNFADLLKHIVLVEILEHLTKKDKPFDYIDTHSGAGLYDLNSGRADKLAEYLNGIGKLTASDWPELENYFSAINACNTQADSNLYPGSPLIAANYLRAKDRAWLYELHPSDFKLLQQNTRGNRRIKVMQEDSLSNVLSLLPPASRRGLLLMDPSYEIKSDYEQVFNVIKSAHKKFATGTYALWYPVVERQRINQLEQRFIKSGIKNIQRFELGLNADSTEHGMTSSGMIVINPPWMLFEKMSKLLPRLCRAIDENGEAFSKCDVLVTE